MAEVQNRALVVSQRDKDRRFRVNAFSQPIDKFHTGNLFDIEAKASDLAEHTWLLFPTLVSNFRPFSAGEVEVIDINSPVTLTGDQLKPMNKLIDGLLCMGDDKVNIQQMTATTRAGYV